MITMRSPERLDPGNIIFGGLPIADIGEVIVRAAVTTTAPARKVEVVDVPGRSGSIVIPQNAWSNATREYSIFFVGETYGDYEKAVTAINAWLHRKSGYQRLEDTFAPEIFRNAFVNTDISVENVMNAHGSATLSFNCKPQRFLKTGEKSIAVVNGGNLRNPTGFPALPEIIVTGTGSGTLTIGEYSCSILNIDGEIHLDSESGNAYDSAGNRNTDTSIAHYPELKPGDNKVTFSGGVTGVTIIPHLWEL